MQKAEVSYSSYRGNQIAELVLNKVLWLQQIADRFFFYITSLSPTPMAAKELRT